MSPRELLTLFKETRINLEPTTASLILIVRVPSSGSSFRRSTSSRVTASAHQVAEDERAYRARNLAVASSIFYRKHHSTPRSFLWRVLENETVLSVRVADVCKQEKGADFTLVLNLQFPNPIRPSCIGLADPEEHDALCVFVVDQVNQLHTITLRPDAFKRKSVTDGGLGEACKTYSPPGFGFKHPHRLVPVSADKLIITMHDGGILRFDKNKAHDASSANLWKETIYNVAGWGQSLRGLVPFQRNPTIRYEKVSMELTAATSAAVTKMGTESLELLFTVCLDHCMRVWDVTTGQIIYTGDILNTSREAHEVGKWVIDPSQTNLVRIIDDPSTPEQCLVVTFSPISTGEFKFWKVKANQGSIHVLDLFPEHALIPPSPSADVWTLADFAITGKIGSLDLWVLWKNNITYRSQKVHVAPRNKDTTSEPFGSGWKSVFMDNQSPSVELSGPCDSVDTTEKWLDMIFYPGRFSRSTIDTALAMYEKGLGTSKNLVSRGAGKSLAESICSVLGSTATLDRNTTGGLDYEQFRGTSETQWLRLWRLILEIDKFGGEALSFSLDEETGSAWVICAGFVTAIRDCNNMERVYHNLHSPVKSSVNVAALVSAGLNFVESFTDNMFQLSRAALQAELFEDSSKPDLERMQSFTDKAGFWRQITEDDCSAVVDTLGPNFRVVTLKLYTDLFRLVEAAYSPEPAYPLTEFGRKLVVRTVQETAALHQQILFSQLILLVHMEFEFDKEEDALHSRFEVGMVYRQLLSALRRIEHVQWMMKTHISLPMYRTERSMSTSNSFSSSFSSTVGSPPTTKRSNEEPRVVTPFEGLLGHLLGFAEDDQNLISALTNIATDLCALNSETELTPHLQQCWLLRIDRPDLASELSAFNEQEPFSVYIQGRVSLVLKDYDMASLHFKKASIGLSLSTDELPRHSAGLLDDTEWNMFQKGLPNYYSHIVNLFEKLRAHSFVIEFARLGLQFAQAAGDDAIHIKTELQSRLFVASTAISQFDIAHSTLLFMEDDALRKSYLRKLIERMCETNQNAELVSLPFSGLQNKVDEILLEKCRSTKDVLHDVPYHKILYAWRISHNDYRGGAAILLDRLQKLRAMGEGDNTGGADDVMDTHVTRQYLLLINALSCVPADDAYILEDLAAEDNEGPVLAELEASLDELTPVIESEETKSGHVGDQDSQLAERMKRFSKCHSARQPRRRLLTLVDLRKNYHQELDRIVAIQTNQFGITGGDDMVLNTTGAWASGRLAPNGG